MYNESQTSAFGKTGERLGSRPTNGAVSPLFTPPPPPEDKGEMKLKLDLRQAKSAEMLNGPSLKSLWKRGGGLPAALLAPGGGRGGRR